MIYKIKQRKKQHLLPDYQQIEALRIGFAELYSRNRAGIFLPPNTERVLSSEEMEKLKQYIIAEKFDESWEIVDKMIENQERTIFAVVMSIIVIAIMLFILTRN